ncbi:MAG: reverse transcriptase family protein [Hydrococcus sp. Prado102]|jgi:retron-type reverse transcriptase|nr:reverse transcriptase family protein [Hydrococcus sp. Prado102]
MSLKQQANLEKLHQKGLPKCNTNDEIALAMGISVEKLCFLAFKPLTSPTVHYFRFKIFKRTGQDRIISAPMPNLKTAQKWILKNILEKIEVHDAAHGFRHNRSIVTNAQPHVGADIIVNIDLQNFFQAISYRRIKSLFCELGYSETASTIFGLICTVTEIENENGKVTGKRYLPQGSPASPTLSNLVCYNLDSRLASMAKNFGFCYTRYADDLTFSASGEAKYKVSNLLQEIQLIIDSEGFAINPDKTQILKKSVRQKVMGIVVNKRLNLSKKTLKAFRATLHQIEQEGLSNKHWGNSTNLINAIAGFASYVAMVNPSKGAEFMASVERIKQKYGCQE